MKTFILVLALLLTGCAGIGFNEYHPTPGAQYEPQ